MTRRPFIDWLDIYPLFLWIVTNAEDLVAKSDTLTALFSILILVCWPLTSKEKLRGAPHTLTQSLGSRGESLSCPVLSFWQAARTRPIYLSNWLRQDPRNNQPTWTDDTLTDNLENVNLKCCYENSNTNWRLDGLRKYWLLNIIKKDWSKYWL